MTSLPSWKKFRLS
jgi:hypothetical protein